MKVMILVSVLLLGAAPLAAQGDVDIDTSTPEGQHLQVIGSTEDTAEKVQLMEQFLQNYPNHKAVAWVLAQLPPAYAELDQAGKSLAACEKMLEKSPTNAAGAHGCLKTAEAQQDPALVKKWALATRAAATKAVEAPKPDFEYEDEEQEWNANVDYARQVGDYSEWALYNAALQAKDPAVRLDFINALKSVNPEHEHLDTLMSQQFLLYRQAGQVDQAVALAEDLETQGKANEDMLLVVADYYFNQKKDSAKSLEYCGKLIEYLKPKEAPEGIAPETWDAKKKSSLGLAYWFQGVTYSSQGKYASADKVLRKALPNVADNPQLKAGALFHLGVANFQMGNKSGNEKQILAAFNYTKQCAAMSSPFQAQAAKNLKAIQGQYHIR